MTPSKSDAGPDKQGFLDSSHGCSDQLGDIPEQKLYWLPLQYPYSSILLNKIRLLEIQNFILTQAK